MGSVKKRRELNRAREEHERSRVHAELAQGRVDLESISESIIGQHVKELEEKLAAAQARTGAEGRGATDLHRRT